VHGTAAKARKSEAENMEIVEENADMTNGAFGFPTSTLAHENGAYKWASKVARLNVQKHELQGTKA